MAASTDTPTLVERVEAYRAEHGGTAKAAFEALAAELGRSPNAVAQSYYSAKRRSRPQPRVSAARASAPRRRARANGGSLADRVAALEAENAELRAFRDRIMRILNGDR